MMRAVIGIHRDTAMNLTRFHRPGIGLSIAFLLLAASGAPGAAAPDATVQNFTCSGQLWNIHTEENGTSWLELGHGIQQCSIRNTSSENAKRILSVCNVNADCSLQTEVDARRYRKSIEAGECDGVCIFEADKILWVKKGKVRQ